jgi:hypothetical protein
MFDVYTKDVVMKTQNSEDVYKLRPLSGKFYPKFSAMLGKFEKTASGGEFNLSDLDESVFGIAHELCVETLKKSYPDMDINTLEEFVSQNLMTLISALIQVNMNTGDK